MDERIRKLFHKHPQWDTILVRLRKIILETGLEETVKWGLPTYTYDNKNICGIGAFKSYAGIWFFNGALLKDKHQKLINAQEGKTVAMRQWRFSSIQELDEKLITEYIIEAIENQKAGRKINPVKKP